MLPAYNDCSDILSVTGLRAEPSSVRLQQKYTNAKYPKPLYLYEIDGDGDRDGVLIE